MDPSISTLIPLFRATDQLFHRALEGVTPADLLRRPHDGSNPLIWIAGHAMSSRASLLRIAGEKFENPWSDLFARGVTIDSDVIYPEIGEIIALWDSVTERLMPRLESLNDDELASPVRFPVPTGDSTKRGAIVFLNYHETYHIGQMAYLRKWLGYTQLVG